MHFYLALILTPITIGWAAGDVSNIAYIQEELKPRKLVHNELDVAASFVGFLNVVFVTIYSIINSYLGKYFDSHWSLDEEHGLKTAVYIRLAQIINFGSVNFTMLAVNIFVTTFLVKGSWH
jgi:hypothetical protein